jgi:hypothetical protein
MRRATSLRTTLVVLAAIAAAGVAWTSAAVARSDATGRSAEIALAATTAALEASRERGLSAAVVTSDDDAYAQELRFQRGQTDDALRPMAKTIDCCWTARSVAELGAEVRAPLTVVRVIVADLYTVGMVDVDRSDDVSGEVALLQRMIRGVKAIA